MRSQFPRHLATIDDSGAPGSVSISDEKPVPSPRGAKFWIKLYCVVSISDEKPVPSPR